MNYGESSRVVSEGNLKFSDSTNNSTYARIGANLPLQGKWYWEVLISGTLSSYLFANGTFDIEDNNNIVSGTTNSTELTGCHCIRENGKYYDNNSLTASYASFSSGDILQVYFDADIGSLFMGRNGTAFNSGSAVATSLPAQEIHCSVAQNDAFSTYNFGQDSSFAGAKTAQGNTDGNGIGDFYYEPPSGFLALCTANLPEPTIGPNSGANNQSDDHFNTVLYSGNGSNSHAITGVGFQPDWLWIKRRDGANSHVLMDSSRGKGSNDSLLALLSNVNDAEYDLNDHVRSLDSDGFTLDDDTDNTVATNNSSQTYVAWNWKANGGNKTSFSESGDNPAGTHQANQTAGFSIVTTTGTGDSGATIAHGLNAIPKMIISKRRTPATHWAVYHHALGTGSEVYLDLPQQKTNSNFWITDPTTSVFSVSNSNYVNTLNDTYIFYCFAEVEGYSKIGSYTGNENADGSFVYTGFKPAFFIIKRTDEAHSWRMFDNKRSDYNTKGNYLTPDSSDEEGATLSLDFLSNGFKIRTNNDGINGTGSPHIYMAFAEAPFKYANAR